MCMEHEICTHSMQYKGLCQNKTAHNNRLKRTGETRR